MLHYTLEWSHDYQAVAASLHGLRSRAPLRGLTFLSVILTHSALNLPALSDTRLLLTCRVAAGISSVVGSFSSVAAQQDLG